MPYTFKMTPAKTGSTAKTRWLAQDSTAPVEKRTTSYTRSGSAGNGRSRSAMSGMRRRTHRRAIETMCTSFGKTSLQRPNVPANIGPYVKPTTADDSAFPMVDLTKKISMIMEIATPEMMPKSELSAGGTCPRQRTSNNYQSVVVREREMELRTWMHE